MATISSEDGDVGFQIAPMVDVVFVLMLFFMASAATQLVPSELSTTLPAPSGQPIDESAAPVGYVFIDVLADDRVVLNGQPMDEGSKRDLPELTGRLQAVMEFGGEDVVVIRPDANVRHQRVVDVMNAAAEANVANLTFH